MCSGSCRARLLPALRVGSQQIASRMATAEQESAAADVAQLEVAFESLGMEPPKRTMAVKEEVAELQEDARREDRQGAGCSRPLSRTSYTPGSSRKFAGGHA